MYPTFCTYRDETDGADPYFARVATLCSLGNALPGLAMAEEGDGVRVVISVDGRQAVLHRASVRLGLSETASLALMDAVEEAIEDAREAEPHDPLLVERMEATLMLFEASLPAD